MKVWIPFIAFKDGTHAWVGDAHKSHDIAQKKLMEEWEKRRW